MSHFTVAVFSDGNKTIEELLAPYQENNMDDCPKEFLKFNDVTDEHLKQYENDGTEMARDINGELKYKWDIPEDQQNEIIYMKHKDKYKTFDEFMLDYCGYEKDEKTNTYGYWGNPNAEWDWYQIGGRWSGLLKLKSGATTGELGERSWANKDKEIDENRVDSAKIKDIDFSLDLKEYNKALRFWELIVDREEPKDKEEEEDVKFCFYKPTYYSNRYESKEQYAKLTSEFGTYAVITPDGVWHSKGDMGWWGCSSESDEEAKNWNMSFKERFVDTTNPEWTLTVVDCHI